MKKYEGNAPLMGFFNYKKKYGGNMKKYMENKDSPYIWVVELRKIPNSSPYLWARPRGGGGGHNFQV